MECLRHTSLYSVQYDGIFYRLTAASERASEQQRAASNEEYRIQRTTSKVQKKNTNEHLRSLISDHRQKSNLLH